MHVCMRAWRSSIQSLIAHTSHANDLSHGAFIWPQSPSKLRWLGSTVIRV